MEFYKSRNGRSTSSSSSSSKSNSSHKSHVSSNNGAAYMALEYCTSSSSMSPFAAAAVSSAKTVVTVAIDELIASSGGSRTSSSQITVKRKRRSTNSCDDKDPELGFEPPLAKRQQRLPSFYQSEPGSVVSSVYPSPVDELVNEIDTRSSSDCLSDASDYDVAADDIPDSPNSLQAEDDDEVVSATTSPSIASTTSSTASRAYIAQDAQHHQHDHHHGERTPGLKTYDEYLSSHYCLTPAAEAEPPRMCPLPALSWANAQDVWQLMCKKDEQAACFRDATMLENHPGLQPRMRAILLDWLIEVCEVYKLHRETYYLAVDYLDRYLSTQKKVQKTHLQLIGITCLFIAAKVEEIYPPKIGEFAYVTDGACQEDDILQHEILLLQALEWSISPVTAMGWLGVYMQLNVNNRTPATFGTEDKSAKNDSHQKSYTRTSSNQNSVPRRSSCSARKAETTALSSDADVAPTNDAFIYPQFSGMEFVQTAQLLDLCSLDVGMGNFPYSVIAAAAISHTFDRETALSCSGLDWHTIQPCARWMEPFFKVICEESEHLHLLEQNEQVASKYGLGHICPNIVTDDSHIIQTHTTTMAMFDRACLIHEQYQQKYLYSKIKQEASPAMGLVCPAGLLTPPASSRKPFGTTDDEGIEKNPEKVAALKKCS